MTTTTETTETTTTENERIGNLEFAIAEINEAQLSELLDDISHMIELRGFECVGRSHFENVADLEKEVEELLGAETDDDKETDNAEKGIEAT